MKHHLIPHRKKSEPTAEREEITEDYWRIRGAQREREVREEKRGEERRREEESFVPSSFVFLLLHCRDYIASRSLFAFFLEDLFAFWLRSLFLSLSTFKDFVLLWHNYKCNRIVTYSRCR